MRKRRADPVSDTVMHVVPRLRSNDCATWALATFLNLSYPEVLAAVHKIDKKHAGGEGLYITQIQHAANLLGFSLHKHRGFDLKEDCGILLVNLEGEGHAVVLKGGQIIDVDGTIWTAEDYLSTKPATPTSILTMKKRGPRHRA